MTTTEPGEPRWAPPAALGLSITGLVLSVYLTAEHYTAPGTLSCPANATVDCVRVTTSAESSLFGVPVAVLGMAFFAAMAVVSSPMVWRRSEPWLPTMRLATAATGVGFVLYLVFAELFLVGTICLWCTAVHVVAFALYAVVAVSAALRPQERVHRRSSRR